MNKIAVNLVILLFFQKSASTSGVEQRIEVLKEEIEDEIAENAIKATQTIPTLFPKDYFDDKVVTESAVASIGLITTYHDTKHKKHKKKKGITEKGIDHTITMTSKKISRKQEVSEATPAIAYYRKTFFDNMERNKPQRWTHCLDLITPFLNGHKENFTVKQTGVQDGTVLRLVQLLSIDTSHYSKEDILSILYQISNLNLRLYQWDVYAITTLFNTIIRDNVHNFRTLKAGIKALFRKWYLDTSNISTFIDQTRIFRPPCIQISENTGSTKSSKIARYTNPNDKNKKKRNENDKQQDSDCSD